MNGNELFVLYIFLAVLVGMIAGLAYITGAIISLNKDIKKLIERTEKIEERIENEVLTLLKEMSKKKSKK
jgi:sensor domain CHASE-containing protein